MEVLPAKEGVYVLRCENDYYYIGYSLNIANRVIQHFNRQGSRFTRTHHPVECVEWILGGKNLEWATYVRYRDKYGAAKVGGAGCSQVKDVIINETSKNETNIGLKFNITQVHIDKAIEQLSKQDLKAIYCPVAISLKEVFKGLVSMVCHEYVLLNDDRCMLAKYNLSESLIKEVVAFDEGWKFTPGEYEIIKVYHRVPSNLILK